MRAQILLLIVILCFPVSAQTRKQCYDWIDGLAQLEPAAQVELIEKEPQMAEMAFNSMLFNLEGESDPERHLGLLNLIARVAWVKWGRSDLRARLEDSGRSRELKNPHLEGGPDPELRRRGKLVELERRRLELLFTLSLLISVENYQGGLEVLDAVDLLLEESLALDPEAASLALARVQTEAARLILAERLGLFTRVLKRSPEVLRQLSERGDPLSQLSLQLSLALAARRALDFDALDTALAGIDELAKGEGNQQALARFVAATLRAELEWKRNPEIRPDQLSAAHRAAWQHLDQLNPLRWTGSYWTYGAEAARIWLAFIGDLPPEFGDAGVAMTEHQNQALDHLGQQALKIRADIADPLLQHVFIDSQYPTVMLMKTVESYLGALEVYAFNVGDQGKTREYLDYGERLIGEVEESVLFHQKQTRQMLGRPVEVFKGSGAPRLKGRFRFTRALIMARQWEFKVTPEQARALAEELNLARGDYRRGGDPSGDLDLVPFLGWCQWKAGQPSKARESLTEGRERALKLGRWKVAFRSLKVLGELERAQGRPEQALEYYRRAVEEVEQAIQRLGGTLEAGRRIREQWSDCYQELAQLQLELEQPREAMATLDRSQQLATVTEVAGRARSADREVVDKLQRYRGQQAKIVELRREVDQLRSQSAPGPELQQQERLLADTRASFFKTAQEIRRADPRLYDATLSMSPFEFGRLQTSIPEGVGVVQYFPTEEKLYIFVVTRAKFRIREVALPWKSLDRSVRLYRRSVQRGARLTGEFDWESPEGSELKEVIVQLHQGLIGPVEEDLSDCGVLVVVPARSLNYLPFSSLARVGASGLEFLGQRKAVAMMSKASDFYTVIKPATPPGGASFLGFGNPSGDLPAAAQEVDRLGGLFESSRVYLGDQATTDRLLGEASGAEFLHLATHGVLSPGDPAQSYLAMAGGGRLTALDIYGLQLPRTTLVTLSACQTALAENNPGQEVFSIAQSFWVAGPSSVVASLWRVDDRSTEEFMLAFYTGLKKGLSKGDALRQAQGKLRENPGTAHPFHWAPFVLIGDWK